MADKELKAKVEEIRINVKDWRIDLDAGVFEGTPEDVRTPEDLLAYIDVLESRQPDTELVEALRRYGKCDSGCVTLIDHNNIVTCDCGFEQILQKLKENSNGR